MAVAHKTFHDLVAYLRRFTNIGGDPAHDAVGVLLLIAALADNLRDRYTAEELSEAVEAWSATQADYLGRLAALRGQLPGDP